MKLVHRLLSAFVLACLLGSASLPASGMPTGQVVTAEEHITVAQAAFGRQPFSEARKEVNRALSIAKDSGDAYFLRARINRLEGKLADALKDIKKTLEFKPGYAEAQVLYSRLLFETGQHNEARIQFERALSLTGADANSLLLKGDMNIGDGKYESATGSYEAAIRLLPEGDPAASVIRLRLDAVKNRLAFEDPFCYSNERPVPLNRPRPEFSGKALDSRTQGIVTLALLVGEKGDVIYYIVQSGLKDGLSGEAIKAARRIKFKPALQDGKPIPFLQVIEVEFKLR